LERVGKEFSDDPRLLKILNKSFEEVKEIFDEPIFS